MDTFKRGKKHLVFVILSSGFQLGVREKTHEVRQIFVSLRFKPIFFKKYILSTLHFFPHPVMGYESRKRLGTTG